MKNLTILGSTGSIGQNTLNVVKKNKNELCVKAITANKNWQLLAQQAKDFNPELVVIQNKEFYEPLKSELKNTGISVKCGNEAIEEAAALKSSDTLVSAIVGFAGLKPTMQAILNKKNICLANKETLVSAGKFIMEAAKSLESAIIPIDSEHSAIYQCIGSNNAKAANVNKLIITASGGPFRTFEKEKLKSVTAKQALKHPNWSMGAKITIDSATLMNKGLEVIEAHWLFNMPFEQIEVVVHPQSIIHSLVEFSDGSVLAQLGLPDMKLPIQYALSAPKRWQQACQPLNLAKIQTLTFEEPRFNDFLCLKHAYEAGKKGQGATCVLNAANEIAVEAFLQNKIKFTDIPQIIQKCLQQVEIPVLNDINDIIKLDTIARNTAELFINREREQK